MASAKLYDMRVLRVLRAAIALWAIRSPSARIAQSAIRALGYAIAPHGAIRSACRPISLSLNTGSGRGYVLGLGPLRAYAAPALGFA